MARNALKYCRVCVDRIEPSVGYLPNNIAVISWRANRLKSDASPTEIAAIATYVASKDQTDE